MSRPGLRLSAETGAVCADILLTKAGGRGYEHRLYRARDHGSSNGPLPDQGGHELFVFGKRRLPADVREAGATVCDTLKAIAERSETIILMVPDTPDVRSVLFDPDGVAEGLSRANRHRHELDLPIETKLFAAEINKKGCDYFDAPVSGGEVGAKAASLTIMVGGPERAFAKVKPLFELMGKNITLVGANGDGQTTKVANQIIVALTIEAVGEACMSVSLPSRSRSRQGQAGRTLGGFASLALPKSMASG